MRVHIFCIDNFSIIVIIITHQINYQLCRYLYKTKSYTYMFKLPVFIFVLVLAPDFFREPTKLSNFPLKQYNLIHYNYSYLNTLVE